MPTSLNIGKIKKLSLEYKDVTDLRKKIGTTEWKLKTMPDFDRDATFEVFGEDVNLSVEASAAPLIHPADKTVDPFDDGQGMTAPAGHSFAELHLKAGIGVETKFERAYGPLKAGVEASVGSEAHYHHIIPVKRSDVRLNAIKDVVAGSRPVPATLKLATVRKTGAIHVYDAWVNVDLGLSARYGAEIDLDEVVDLFDDIPSTQIQAHVALTARAGLGWSMYRKMRVVVAPSPGNPDWLRARFESQKRRRFSLNAGFDLKAEYDLTRPLDAILDYALELDPVVDVVEALEKVARLESDAGWNKVRDDLEERLGDELVALFEDTGWREWLASSPEAKQLVDFSRKLVASYDGFNRTVKDRVRALWAEILGSTSLGSDQVLRKAIERIAEIDTDDLDLQQFLGEESSGAVELLETLSGRNVQELLFSESVKREVGVAVRAARQVQDALDTGPEDILKRFEELQERSGIRSVADFLKENATSKEDLEAAIESEAMPRIRGLAERLTDKAYGLLDDDDIAKIKKWAGKARGLLNQKDDWENSARNAIRQLKGDFGFSLSLEFERVTESQAVLDLEFDPGVKALRSAVGYGLRRGDITGLLAKLPEIDTDDGDTRETAWQIREGLFTSRRTRTGTIAILSTLGGTGRRGAQTTQEMEIRLGRGGRTASYAASFARRLERPDLPISEATASWVANATGAGLDLGKPYDAVSDEMRLQLLRVDRRVLPDEVAGLEILMTGLGFSEDDAHPIRTAVVRTLEEEGAVGSPLPELDGRFTVEVRLPQDAVDHYLLNDPSTWNRDLLNAAHRWYTESLIPVMLTPNPGIRAGDVLAEVLKHPEFRRNWTRGFQQFGTAIRDHRLIVVVPPNQRVEAKLLRRSGNFWRFENDYDSLGSLILKRTRASRRIDQAEATHRVAMQKARPRDLEKAARKISRAFRVSSAKGWPNPGFLPWLILSRSAGAGQDLSAAKGVATFQWRRRPDDDYRMHVWQLENGIPDLTPMFPME